MLPGLLDMGAAYSKMLHASTETYGFIFIVSGIINKYH